MDYLLLSIGAITFFSTLVGGLTAIRFKNVLQYFFAFSAGSLIAVSFFDLMPEVLNLSVLSDLPIRYAMVTSVAIFFLYSVIERYSLTHHFHDESGEHKHIMGPVGAGGLIIHSFFDGVAIGTAYQVNAAIGMIVALAVIFHDFGDGVNTVTLMLKNRYHKEARLFLLMGAVAPILGILVAGALSLSPAVLALILAAFIGEFLYIGAANLLPETYKHVHWKMVLAMGLGLAVIFLATSVV